MERFRRKDKNRRDPLWWRLPVIGRLSVRRTRVLALRGLYEDPAAVRRMVDAPGTDALLRDMGYERTGRRSA